MKSKKIFLKIIIGIVAGIILNILPMYLIQYKLELPLFMDTLGSITIAFIFGGVPAIICAGYRQQDHHSRSALLYRHHIRNCYCRIVTTTQHKPIQKFTQRQLFTFFKINATSLNSNCTVINCLSCINIIFYIAVI